MVAALATRRQRERVNASSAALMMRRLLLLSLLMLVAVDSVGTCAVAVDATSLLLLLFGCVLRRFAFALAAAVLPLASLCGKRAYHRIPFGHAALGVLVCRGVGGRDRLGG